MAGSAHPGNPVNAAPAKAPSNVSRFPLSYKFLSTEQFGKCNVFFAKDIVRGAKETLSCPVNLRSYTLKTPLFGKIRKNMDYHFVAKDAILPINADKVNVQPTIGDDIPDGVNCSIKDAPYKMWLVVSRLWTWFQNNPASELGEHALQLLRCLAIGEYFFSPGSLLAQCGSNYMEDCYWIAPGPKHFYVDDLIDKFWEGVASDDGVTIRVVDGTRTTSIGVSPSRRGLIRLLVERIHDEPGILFDGSVTFTGGSDFDALIAEFASLTFVGTVSSDNAPDAVLNFGRLAAYQIACHSYYSNDKVDYIFSAELYRELMGSYIQSLVELGSLSSNDTVFSYNGLSVRFDWLSGHFLDFVLQNFDPSPAFGSDIHVNFVSYIAGLFSFRRSLRYVDYFVGAKTNPLAVGDYTAPVSADGVDMLLLSKEKALTRLAFATNQLGSKAKKWLEGIFRGREIEWDKHDPAFIGHTAELIGSQENENTGAAQYQDIGIEGVDTSQVSTTSQFRARTGKNFGFRYNAALPGYIIGITTYDIPRVYNRYRDRQMMAYDRHDEFNPFMQYTGDQPLYRSEFAGVSAFGGIFGYQQKDMQYKQMVNFAVGGFAAGKLPSWYFDSNVVMNDVLFGASHIGPDFLRSHTVELDKFYLSLTGWSLSSYFHFIVVYNDDLDAVQPMAWISTLKV